MFLEYLQYSLQSYACPYRKVTTSAYSSRIWKVFASAYAAGASWSRSSDLLPVQSIKMSPGSTMACAPSAVTTAAVRGTGWDWRASMSSLSECSMVLSGQNPSAQVRSSDIKSGGMDSRNASPAASSPGSKMAATLSSSMSSLQ